MVDQSICKAIALALFVFAWTHFAITDNAIFFFHILAPCCFALFGSLFLTVKYRDFDFNVNLVGVLFTFNNLIDEFFFDPQKLQINEYVFAIITIIILIARARKKYIKRKENKYLWQAFKPRIMEEMAAANDADSFHNDLADNSKATGIREGSISLLKNKT